MTSILRLRSSSITRALSASTMTRPSSRISPLVASRLASSTETSILSHVAQRHRQAVYELRRAIDQQAGLDQRQGAVEMQHVRLHRHRQHPVLVAQQRLQPVDAGEVRGAARDADIDLVAIEQRVAALEERPVDAAGRTERHARPAGAALLHGALDDRPQPVAFALPAEQAERGVDHVIADHDHAVARERAGRLRRWAPGRCAPRLRVAAGGGRSRPRAPPARPAPRPGARCAWPVRGRRRSGAGPCGRGSACRLPGSSQRCDSSWNTTKSSAGEMPMTTSRSLPHS